MLKAGKPANAEPILRESLASREKNDAGAWQTFSTKSLLGDSLLGQKKYADAEPLLLEGYEGMKKRATKIPLQFRQARLSEAAERLVQLYEATENTEQAKAWQKKLAEDSVNAFLFQLPNVTVADAKLKGLWKNAPIFVNDLSALSWQ